MRRLFNSPQPMYIIGTKNEDPLEIELGDAVSGKIT